MAIIDEKCPTCGGDLLETRKESGGGKRTWYEYKCLSHPRIGHLPPNWQPEATS